MNDEKKHFEQDLELKVSDRLSADLKALFTPEKPAPSEADYAVMNRAHQQLISRQRKSLILRWSAPATAAAVIIVLFSLYINTEQRSNNSIFSEIIASRTDIDHNGSVDILDAFQLARYMKSTDSLDMKWDINGDGLVNSDDVDSVAFAAVRLNKGVL